MFGLELESLVVRLLLDANQYTRMMDRVEARLYQMSYRIERWGRMLATAVLAPLMLVGGASLKVFSDFDSAMTKSVAIMSGVTPEIRKNMEDIAFHITSVSPTTPKELAGTYFNLASAGYDAAKAMRALSIVESFAIVGQVSMTKSAQYLTQTLSALGLESSNVETHMRSMTRLSDVLSEANRLSQATTDEFAAALANKAANALRFVNKSMEEGVAVLATFADRGIRGAEAGTYLSNVLRDLQRANLRNIETWQQFGMSVYDASGKMLPVANIVAQLEQRFDGMSDAQKRASLMLLGFQDRSVHAMLALIGASHRIVAYENALGSAEGATERIAAVMRRSFGSQMQIMWNHIHMVAIEIGRNLAPFISELNLLLRDLTQWWMKLDPIVKQAIVWIGILTTAFVALNVAFILFVISTSGAAAALVGLFNLLMIPVATVLSMIGLLYAVLSTPIGFVIAAAAILLMIVYSEELSEWLGTLTDDVLGLGFSWETIVDTARDYFLLAIGFLYNFRNNMTVIMQWILDNWNTMWTDLGEMGKVAFVNVVHNSQVAIMALFRWIESNWVKIVIKLCDGFLVFGKFLRDQGLPVIFSLLMDLGNFLLAVMKDMWLTNIPTAAEIGIRVIAKYWQSIFDGMLLRWVASIAPAILRGFANAIAVAREAAGPIIGPILFGPQADLVEAGMRRLADAIPVIQNAPDPIANLINDPELQRLMRQFVIPGADFRPAAGGAVERAIDALAIILNDFGQSFLDAEREGFRSPLQGFESLSRGLTGIITSMPADIENMMRQGGPLGAMPFDAEAGMGGGGIGIGPMNLQHRGGGTSQLQSMVSSLLMPALFRSLNELNRSTMNTTNNNPRFPERQYDATMTQVDMLNRQLVAMTEIEAALAGTATLGRGGFQMAGTDFKEIAPSRFMIEGLAAFGKSKKQEVSDPVVHNKMDTLIDVVRGGQGQPILT